MTYKPIVSVKKLMHTVSPTTCFTQLVQAYGEYQRVVQEECTKRQAIEAWKKTTLARIQQRRDEMIEFLTLSFDERAENFKSFFALADQAIASGDTVQLGLVLHSIVELAKSSPFKDLADLEKVKDALDDPNYTWEV